jgi:hypothetical protein
MTRASSRLDRVRRLLALRGTTLDAELLERLVVESKAILSASPAGHSTPATVDVPGNARLIHRAIALRGDRPPAEVLDQVAAILDGRGVDR